VDVPTAATPRLVPIRVDAVGSPDMAEAVILFAAKLWLVPVEVILPVTPMPVSLTVRA
jgi:hypothetical protein